MPWAAIAAIAALASAGAGIGQTIYSDLNQPSGPKPTDPAEITKQAVSAETANRQTATKEAAQFLPQLQSDTGGGLSPDALKQFSSTFSGNANLANSPEMSQMVAKFLGLDTGATFGGSEPFGSSSGGSNPLAPGLVS